MNPSSGLEFFYFQAVDIWKQFCEAHRDLYEVTCEEYRLLLKSDLDQLTPTVEHKNLIVNYIGELDIIRQSLIGDLASFLGDETPVESVHDLLKVMNYYEETNQKNYLQKYNALLIDLIEKIQDQNRNNHIFLEKALRSISQVRHEVMGIKSYSTYNKQGRTNQITVPIGR